MTTWLLMRDGNFHKRKNAPTSRDPLRRYDMDREPCPTVSADGIGGVFRHQFWLEDDGVTEPIPRAKSTAARRGQRSIFDGIKPPYRVPLMSEIREVPWNGLTVVTTFAGCGGSSTGYRMAGYRLLWANEFVPAAQDSYRANMDPRTILDGRDIKKVTAAEILRATGLKRGELDVLDGSPPCQAFSTAGLREKGWGKERQYEHGASQKNEELFTEFIRLRNGLMPLAFVAENVSGLVKGAAKGFFLEIMKELKVGYRVEAQLLDAQWLGVPQARQRLVFVGVREDLALAPAFPVPFPYRYSVRDAIPWIGHAVHDTKGQPQYSAGEITNRPAPAVMPGQGGRNAVHFQVTHATGRKGQPSKDITDEPSPTITAGPDDAAEGGGPRNHFLVEETRVIQGPEGDFRKRGRDLSDHPAPTVLAGDGSRRTPRQFEVEVQLRHGEKAAPSRKTRGANISVDAPMPTVRAGTHGSGPHQFELETRMVQNGGFSADKMRDNTDEPAFTVTTSHRRRSAPMVEIVHRGGPGDKPRTKVRSSVDDPAHTVSAHGYAAAGKGQTHVVVQKIANNETVADNVAASIEGYAIEAEYDKLRPGQASDKFFNLIRADETKPSPTVTSQGTGGGGSGAPGGVASVCHPTEKRKFTIAELRRICAFPDDFALTGTYAQQWERLGNSVPPLMMRAVAEVLRDAVLLPARAAGKSGRSRPGGPATPRAASPGASPAAPSPGGRSRARERLERIGARSPSS